MDGISVIVPAYNAELYIGKCVESILSQTYDNYEVVIVDDGSTDKTGLICDEYARKNDKIIVVHAKNGGISSARNIGLQISTKKYVTFLDSDDYLESVALETIYNDFTKLGAVTMLSYQYNIVFDNKKEVSDLDTGLVSSDMFVSGILNYNGASSVWGKAFYTKYAKQCQFSTLLQLGEDTKYLIDYLDRVKGTVYCSSSVTYNYFQRSSSTSHRKENLFKLTSLNMAFLGYYRSKEITDERRLSIINYIVANVCIKLRGGCFDSTPDERFFLNDNLCRCTAKLGIFEKQLLKVFTVSPYFSCLLMTNLEKTKRWFRNP